MGVDLFRQLHIALGAALLGVMICLFFESVRIVGFFLRGTVWVFVLDFLRIVGAAIMNLLYFHHYADGQIRWYDLVFECLAGWLFHICVGRFAVRFVCSVATYIIEFLKKLLRICLLPFRFVFRYVAKTGNLLAKNTICFFKKVFIFLYKYIIMLLYPFRLSRKKNRKETKNHGKETEKQEISNSSRFFH